MDKVKEVELALDGLRIRSCLTSNASIIKRQCSNKLSKKIFNCSTICNDDDKESLDDIDIDWLFRPCTFHEEAFERCPNWREVEIK